VQISKVGNESDIVLK